MFVVHRPLRRDILKIQAAEQAYYWSACAAGFLRKHGLIAVSGAVSGRRAPGFSIVTRRARHRPGAEPACFEGPLTPDVASSLGIEVREHTAEAVTLITTTGRTLGRMSYPRLTVRRKPRRKGEQSEPYPHVSDDPYWNNRLISCQELKAGEPWKVIAHARLDGNSPLVPIAVSDGRRLVLGLPLFDLIGYAHCLAPLDVGLNKIEDRSDPFPAECWFIDQLISHAIDGGQWVLRAADWPRGFRSALTVRHDYDRIISDEGLADLLKFYEDRGIRSSWGFLVSHGRADHARRLVARGHEVLLHTVADSRKAFAAETRTLRRSTGIRVSGYTSHGGLGAAGYLGETQFHWAERCGMLYGEILQKPNHLPSRALAIRRGTPCLTRLVLPVFHVGMDENTKPDGHRLEHLCKTVPARLAAGDYVVLMNHPDIHIPQLKELLGAVDLSTTWSTTLHDVAAWTDVAKFRSRVRRRRDIFEIDFGATLPLDTIVTLHGPAGDGREFVAHAGSKRLTIPDPTIPAGSPGHT